MWRGYRSKWFICAIASIVWFIAFMERQSIAATLPFMIKDLGLTYTQAGLLPAFFLILYALMQLPFGLLADRFGPRLVISLATSFYSFFQILTGAARGFGRLLLWRSLVGVGQGGSFVPSIKLISTWFDERRRSTAIGIFQAFGSQLGAIAAMTLLPFICLKMGWPYAFYLTGAMGIIAGALTILFVRDQPQKHQVIEESTVKVEEGPKTRHILRRPYIWTLSVFTEVASGSSWTWQMWGFTFLLKGLSLPLYTASLSITIFTIIAFFGLILGGWLSDKYGRKIALYLGFSSANVGYLFLTLVESSQEKTLFLYLLWGSIFFLGMSRVYLSSLFALPGELTSVEAVGTALGFCNTWNFISGGILSIVFGFLSDMTNTFKWSWLLAFGISMMGSPGIYLTRRLKEKEARGLSKH